MVIIVKKLVPVYSESENVPKQYKNLRKAVYVTSFKHLYPNILTILTSEYGLKPSDKVVVFWTKEVQLPRFNRYRVNFRKVYSGPLTDLPSHLESIRLEGKRYSAAGVDEMR